MSLYNSLAVPAYRFVPCTKSQRKPDFVAGAVPDILYEMQAQNNADLVTIQPAKLSILDSYEAILRSSRPLCLPCRHSGLHSHD